MPEIILSEVPSADDLDTVLEGLLAYNRVAQPNVGYQPLAVFVRDGGKVVGGLTGHTSYDWLFIQILHLPVHLRGKGIGTEIMQRAETWSRTRGLTGIWLDTFEFQARGFYEKLGFDVFGTIDDYPKGKARYFMRKRLA